MPTDKKPKRPSLGSGLAENAARALEGRGSKLDRLINSQVKGGSKKDKKRD